MKKVIMRTAIIIIMYPPTFIKYTKHKQTLKQKQKQKTVDKTLTKYV
jgi:hypothetical protein